MKVFRFRFPRWHVAIAIVMFCVVAWAAYRTATRPSLHWFDALYITLLLVLPMIGLWREVRQLGATLTISEAGIECAHPEHPSQNWRIPWDDIERIGTFENLFNRSVVVVRKSGISRPIAPAYWEPTRAAPNATRDALVRALAERFPTGTMDRQDLAKVMAPAMELGRVAARLTTASAVMAAITIGVLFSIPLDMLGDGIPWLPILVVFGSAVALGVWLVQRDPTAQLRVPMVPFLFGMTAAFLFTISAQKAVYLLGTPEALSFRLEKTEGRFQIWRDVEGRYSTLEFPAAEGKYRQPGTVVPIYVRTGPFGIQAIAHAEIKASLSNANF